jgi:DedD protein
VVTSSPTKPDVSPPPPPKAAVPVVGSPVTAGGYLVQAASFRRSEDARALQAKLGQKGYAAFTEEAHLGEKGVWYRVYVGPFATDTAAAAAVARLKAEEKLTALVRKR